MTVKGGKVYLPDLEELHDWLQWRRPVTAL